jgi:hypothetical protein
MVRAGARGDVSGHGERVRIPVEFRVGMGENSGAARRVLTTPDAHHNEVRLAMTCSGSAYPFSVLHSTAVVR